MLYNKLKNNSISKKEYTSLLNKLINHNNIWNTYLIHIIIKYVITV